MTNITKAAFQSLLDSLGGEGSPRFNTNLRAAILSSSVQETLENVTNYFCQNFYEAEDIIVNAGLPRSL